MVCLFTARERAAGGHHNRHRSAPPLRRKPTGSTPNGRRPGAKCAEIVDVGCVGSERITSPSQGLSRRRWRCLRPR
eukprot:3642827-Rhodomonas_salina.2